VAARWSHQLSASALLTPGTNCDDIEARNFPVGSYDRHNFDGNDNDGDRLRDSGRRSSSQMLTCLGNHGWTLESATSSAERRSAGRIDKGVRVLWASQPTASQGSYAHQPRAR
jgi:hypothetical protein